MSASTREAHTHTRTHTHTHARAHKPRHGDGRYLAAGHGAHGRHVAHTPSSHPPLMMTAAIQHSSAPPIIQNGGYRCTCAMGSTPQIRGIRVAFFVSVCVCVCARVCVGKWVGVSVCVCACLRRPVSIDLWRRLCLSTCACACGCACACACVCWCAVCRDVCWCLLNNPRASCCREGGQLQR